MSRELENLIDDISLNQKIPKAIEGSNYESNANKLKNLKYKNLKTEALEKDQAEIVFKKELNELGIEETEDTQTKKLSKNHSLEKTNSWIREAIELKEALLSKGKSTKEVLQILIETYKNNPSLNTFLENWNNFLSLYNLAQEKPPKERKAIEAIIINTDITQKRSFNLALTKIQNSKKISESTKFDIQRKFKTTRINTVRAFDHTLKQEKNYKKNIKKKIQSRNSNIKDMNDDIQNLNDKLDKLPPNDPKRSKLEEKIKEKTKLIKTYQEELSVLKDAKPDKVYIKLRNDFVGILNSDGSRSVKNVSEGFTIQLPSNNLPLMGMKNLRCINTAFPHLALRSLQISDEVFAPDLLDNSIPTKKQRNTAHIILSSLGYNGNQILSEKYIAQLKNDLSCLTDKESGKSGQECLVELGIYDITSQSINKRQFKKALRFIRENRGQILDFKTMPRKIKI